MSLIRLFHPLPMLVGLVLAARAEDRPIQPAGVREMMTRVCDWQLGHFSGRTTNRAEKDTPEVIREDGWIRGVVYAGVLAHYRTVQDQRYLDAALTWAERNRWQLGPKLRNADDQCVGQAYLEMFLLRKDPIMLAGTQARFEQIRAAPRWGTEYGWEKGTNWAWCDALFMAAPTLARLARATGDTAYLTLMNRMWWEAHAYLYDPVERLYFRDASYFIRSDGTGPRTPSGKKVFWGRGNGWALAGLTRVLQFLPGEFADRPRYVALYREIAARIRDLEQNDGLWRSSLDDPEWFPAKESSCSALFCFSLAWGVNAGLIDRASYVPVVERAWRGLEGCVDSSGRIGWVQLTGHDPRLVDPNDTLDYAAGAFLLAGEQMVELEGKPR